MKLHGGQHSTIGNAYNKLGEIWEEKGVSGKAMKYYQKALEIRLKVNGDQHPSTAITYNNIGNILNAKMDSVKAKDCFEKAYSIFIIALGVDHQYTKQLLQKLQKLNDL